MKNKLKVHENETETVPECDSNTVAHFFFKLKNVTQWLGLSIFDPKFG